LFAAVYLLGFGFFGSIVEENANRRTIFIIVLSAFYVPDKSAEKERRDRDTRNQQNDNYTHWD